MEERTGEAGMEGVTEKSHEELRDASEDWVGTRPEFCVIYRRMILLGNH